MGVTSLRLERWILLACVVASCAPEVEVPDGAAEQGEVATRSQALIPSPDSSCTSADFNGKKYFFCTNDRNAATAETRCNTAHPEFHLASIETSDENAFIRARIAVDSWVSGTDGPMEGTWKWQTGMQFWLGGSGGTNGGQYSNWATGQPNNTFNQDCMVIDDNSPGRWSDESCTGTRDYVCEGDGCPTDVNKTDPGQCGCNNLETDSDGDGTANCIDGCPSDSGKIAAGMCGCGTPDTDSDGDGTANCVDGCPNDGERTAPPCSPDADCEYLTFEGGDYFFCDNHRSWAAAKLKCEGVGMQLVRVDSDAENEFIADEIISDRWTAGTDANVEGQWKWIAGDTLFWQGDEDGAPVGMAYTNWESGDEPDNAGDEDCLQFDNDGDWRADECTDTEQYVCEDACPLTTKVAPGVCGCAQPDIDGDGDGTIDCVDGCPADINKTSPGQCDCGNPDTDTDGDGTADCVDACPDDIGKTDPGVCDCGVPDTDSDGDMTADCIDQCAADPLRVVLGQCGCVGEPFALPAGTPCGDAFCPGADECDGEGSCGSPTLDECIPADQPSRGCDVLVHEGHAYLFCTGDLTPTDASDYCGHAGMQLVRIDDEAEDAFVADNLSEPSWIGASDSAVDGEWRWLDGNTHFWQGGAGGAAVDNLYENWEASEPGAVGPGDDCALYDLSGSGAPLGWDDRDCGITRGFVCEVVDQCPADPTKEKPGFCKCGVPEDVIVVAGQQIVVCTDQCPDDATKVAPGVCGCGIPESLCPLECTNNLSNPSSPVYGKLQAGRCGCDTPDVDADSNGVIDCFEGVPQCGTPASPAAPGTPCSDSICAQGCPVTTVCDGAGSCGDPNACAPSGGGACFHRVFRDHVYWFCSGARTRAEAQEICGQDGVGYLVSIDDEAENEFVRDNITDDSWTSGNQTTPGDWTWANATCEDAEPFWDGGETGEPHFANYANWANGAPGTGDFAVMLGGTGPDAGQWQAQSGGTYAFVCEKPRPLTPFCPEEEPECLAEYFGVGDCGPIHEACVPLGEALPDLDGLTEEEALDAIAACDAACTPTSDPEDCRDACDEAGIDPPPETSTCTDVDSPEISEQCLLAEDVNGDSHWYADPASGDPIACRNTAQCAVRGDLPSDVVCGFMRVCTFDPGTTGLPQCPTPMPGDPDVSLEQGGKTGTVRVCGKPSEDCLTGQGADLVPCDTSPLLCEPPEQRQQVETLEFPDGAPQPTCPADLFEEEALPEPDLTVPYPSWAEPCGSGGCTGAESGQNHPFCKYRPSPDGEVMNAIDPDRNHARARNQNESGSPSIIDFEFDPRLDLDYRAKLGPLGLPDVGVTAGAGLVAKAVIHQGVLPFGGDVELINLTAKAHADRCKVTTDGSHMRLFGHDFLPSNASLDVEIAGCEEALSTFENYANRASKAMRDVASLLKQYERAQLNGERLDLSPLCAAGAVLDDPPADFPLPMNCADQPPESHLNELIDYYEQQVIALQTSGAALAEEALTLEDTVPVFEGTSGDEEQTLFAVNFFVGPIPVTLEAFIAAHYDIGLSVGYRLSPGKAVSALMLPNAQTGRDYELLAVFVNGGPSAQAFLGFFAGVGFSFGPVEAKIGIEARLSLGIIGVTADGGAGLLLSGEPDPRPLGEDLNSLALPGSKPFIDPMVYKLKLGYSAGLSANIQDILSGEVNAKLKLEFFFFSKTFRQRLLRFDGLCTEPEDLDAFPCHIPILELGGGTTLGDLPWATVRMDQVLPKLKYLPFVPESDPMSAPPTVPVEMTHLEELFYDRLCSCVADGDACLSNGDCCDFAKCADDGTGATTCGCRLAGETCADDGDCCSGQPCFGGVCQCSAHTEPCETEADCCGLETCNSVPGGGRCGCSALGDVCAENSDCCTDVCVGGTCGVQ